MNVCLCWAFFRFSARFGGDLFAIAFVGAVIDICNWTGKLNVARLSCFMVFESTSEQISSNQRGNNEMPLYLYIDVNFESVTR